MYMLFLGAPGSGKGTHARKLSDEFGMFHLSSGLLLRKAARRKTSGGQVIKRYLTRGRLVPDEITVKLLEREIIKFKEKDIIFDGFPRTISQAEKLDKILSELDKNLDLCIHLNVAEENLLYRLSGRRICSNDGSIYHVEVNPPEKEGKCDICGGNLFQPQGDKKEVAKKRIKEGKKRTRELIEYYKGRVNLETVKGTDRMPEEVHAEINEIVKKYFE